MMAPTIKANWTAAPASQLAERVVADLPEALSWPATAFRGARDNPGASERPAAPPNPRAAE
jgi:hypothetical protein